MNCCRGTGRPAMRSVASRHDRRQRRPPAGQARRCRTRCRARVEVPLTIRLDRLHLVLQAAMGWTNSHLYEIRARDIGWGRPDPNFGDGPLDASKARLIDVLEDVGARSLKYLYDFGDGWEHSVRIERVTDVTP